MSLGYTRSEVNRKFTDADNPIGAIQCDFIARGGETRMFTEAMYQVSRMYKLMPYDQMMENRENKQIENLSDSKLFLIEIISLHQLFLLTIMIFVTRFVTRFLQEINAYQVPLVGSILNLIQPCN